MWIKKASFSKKKSIFVLLVIATDMEFSTERGEGGDEEALLEQSAQPLESTGEDEAQEEEVDEEEQDEEEEEEYTGTHKAGFVGIIGQPNVGKSTLLNALTGERMSIITNKPQTTRHRILGIVSTEDYQLVFSDTPGFIEQPRYKMQERMNDFVASTFEDGDLQMLVVDATEPFMLQYSEALLKKLQQLQGQVPVFLVINKIDQRTEGQLKELRAQWAKTFDFTQVFEVSALEKRGIEELLAAVIEQMPRHPAYYPADQLTDRNERFFVAEIVREKILELYHQEVPYSCEVFVHTFKDDIENNISRIYAYIFVSRATQKQIIIGKGGKAIKALGIAAREAIEEFLQRRVFIELIVKVRDDWRDDEQMLRSFGYEM